MRIQPACKDVEGAVRARNMASSLLVSCTTAVSTITIVMMMMMAYFPTYAAADGVTIVNQMGEELLLHCKSRNDDLCLQTLVNLQEYGFNFHENIWGSTLFWCDFTANGYPPHHQNVYKGSRYLADTCWCSSCNWVVSPKGFVCNGQQQTPWNWAADEINPTSSAP